MRVLAVRRIRDDVGLRQLQAAVPDEDADGDPEQVARAVEGANALANDEDTDTIPHQARPDALSVQVSHTLSNSTPNESPDRLPDKSDESARPVAQPDKWKSDVVSDFVADEDADIEPNSKTD